MTTDLDENETLQQSHDTVEIRWALGGSLGVEPFVFIKIPDDREASWGGGQRALLEAIAEIAGWAKNKAEVLGGNVEPGVMVRVFALHFSDKKKPPRYCNALIKRLTASGLMEWATYAVAPLKGADASRTA